MSSYLSYCIRYNLIIMIIITMIIIIRMIMMIEIIVLFFIFNFAISLVLLVYSREECQPKHV